VTLRSLGHALVAGIAAFLVVGIAVTELAAPRVEFSLFLGIPAGTVAGSVVAAVVVFRFRREGRDDRPALALAGSGVSFLLALLVGVALGAPVGRSTLFAVPAGVVAGIVVYAGVLGREEAPGS